MYIYYLLIEVTRWNENEIIYKIYIGGNLKWEIQNRKESQKEVEVEKNRKREREREGKYYSNKPKEGKGLNR